MIQHLPISHIFTRRDARQTDDGAVRQLADSIREIGIINPLRVRPARRNVNGMEADAFEVTAGAHRLKAARKVGLESVPCIVVEDDDLHAELAMIDENLMRAELGHADRAAQTARRKAIYEELHPETRDGGDRRSSDRKVCDLKADRFTLDTAKATGKSERTIQSAAERGEKISEQALALISGTALDKGTHLDQLKRVPKDKQIDWVKRRLESAESERAASRAPVRDVEDVEEAQKRALLNAWNKATAPVREWFKSEIVDGPVFDRGAA